MANIDSLKREFNRSFLPDSLQADPTPEYIEPSLGLPTQVPQFNMPSMDNFNLVNEQTMNNRFTNPQNAQFLQNSPYTVDQPSFDPYSSFRDFNQRQFADNISQSPATEQLNTPEQGLTFGQKFRNFFGNPVERKEGEGLFANTGLSQEAIESSNERMGQTDYDPFGDDIAAEERAAQQDLMDRYGTTDMNEIRQIAAEGYYGDLANNQMIDPETGSLIELPKAPPRPSMDIASDDEFYDEDIVVEEGSSMPNYDDLYDQVIKEDYDRIVGEGKRPDVEDDIDLSLDDPEFDVDITEKELLADNMPNFNKAWRQIKKQDRRDKFEAGMENVKDKFAAIPGKVKDWRKGQKNKMLNRRFDRYTDKGKLGAVKLSKKDFINKFGEEAGPTEYEKYNKQWSDRTAKIAALLKGKEGEQGGLASMFMALAGQPYQYQKMFDNQNRNYGFPYDMNNQNEEQ